jgi:sigma54-dependent transcription regulator
VQGWTGDARGLGHEDLAVHAETRSIGKSKSRFVVLIYFGGVVGDLPLELQAKLLRILQEGEFERLGSAQTTRVNVRIVAATNGDLWSLVAEKRFRSDLYYLVPRQNQNCTSKGAR